MLFISPDGDVMTLNPEKLENAAPLPADSFFITKGAYQLPDGNRYSFNQPGLYRFFNGTQNRQFLVSGNSLSPLELTKMLSWTVVHGDKDNKKWKEWPSILGQREMSLTCGYITRVASQWYDRFNIPYRILNLKTLEKTNGYDDAHVMVEIFDAQHQQWQLFDPDNNLYFSDSSGAPLSFDKFIDQLYLGSLKTEALSNDPAIDISGFQPYSFATTALYTSNGLMNWYRRVCQSIQTDQYSGELVSFKNEKPTSDSLLLEKLKSSIYTKP